MATASSPTQLGTGSAPRAAAATTWYVQLALAALVCWTVAGAATRPRPNVVLLVVDTLRADHLGCYGYERDTSPRLDALARSGVRFANAYATSSWTGASVASMMTGLYPAVHGLETGASILASGFSTLAEEFRAAGYTTAAFSANPLFVVPEMGLAQGFERFDLLHGPPAERFKLIASKQTGFEAFFDLDHNPRERHDVRTEFPQELAQHRALLETYDADSAPRETGNPGPAPSLDDATRERLRALGYVH